MLHKTNLIKSQKVRSQSRDELERISRIRKIKNYEEMAKEELIISLLKSKQSIAELFNNNLYDNQISDARRILNRLRNMLPRKYRKEIKEKLYEIEHNENLLEENDEYLRKLVRILNDKEKHSPCDRDDLDYYGIRDTGNLFDEASEEDYYKPILVKSSFKDNYQIL